MKKANKHLLNICPLPVGNAVCPSYFVMSTAPINIETPIQELSDTEPSLWIQEMAKYLREQEEDAEVLVLIHGYNTQRDGAKTWYITASEYIRDHYGDDIPKGLIVIGYRWSSETFTQDESGKFVEKLKNMIVATPRLLSLLFWGSLVSSILVSAIGLLKFLLFLTIPILLFVATLMVLRMTVYFRDTFRANHYGVPDLVEFIRQLDRALMQSVHPNDPGLAAAYWSGNRIRLSFIGHSMGAFVVTNAVRILSDVFDTESIGNLDVAGSCKTPSSKIGNAFRLSKLVLVAPDIPVDSIVSGRGNTLRSSLRRFEEAYLFCNKHDVVLKLASTIANYFSFPSRTRDGGYRLGNVFVSGRSMSGLQKYQPTFGIVNLEEMLCSPDDDRSDPLDIDPAKSDEFLDYLFIRNRRSISKRQDDVHFQGKAIAELFTYFDCTDYAEYTKDGKEVGIVSWAWGKPAKGFFAKVSRLVATKKLDTHGGYIYNPNAELSRRLIYGLGCLGFKGFLNTLKNDPAFQRSATDDPVQALSKLCSDRGIQVLLAGERYRVDVRCEERRRDGY